MTNTDIILIVIFITCVSGAGIYVANWKIKQYTSTPQNLLTRRGDIELADFSDPTQPSQVYIPRGLESVDSNNLIRYDPELITVIDGLDSDPISSIPLDSISIVERIESIPLVERLQSDSLNFQPTNYYDFEDLYISSCLENESSFDIILFILIFLFWFWFFKIF